MSRFLQSGKPGPGKVVSLQPGFDRLAGNPASINFNFNNVNREDNFVVKSDYHLNKKNIISGRFFYANSLQTEEDTAPIRPDWLSIANTKVQVMGVNWTWTPNSAWVNEARFGYNHYWQLDNVGDYQKSAADYGLNTGVTDPTLFGFPRDRYRHQVRDGWELKLAAADHSDQDLSGPRHGFSHPGRHNFKFGGEFRHGGTELFRASEGKGFISFDDTLDPSDGETVVVPDLVNFLQGNFGDQGFAEVLTGDIARHVTMTAFGAFVSDDWRIAPRLTLNLGLRYDLSLPIKDANDLIANFLPDKNGLIQVGQGIDAPYATDHNNLSPRIGVAWDVFGTGKTVLRAGGAIIFEQPTIREFIDSGGLNENPSGLPGVTPGTGNINLALRELDDTAALAAAWSAKTPLFAGAQGTPCDISSPCDVFGVPYHISTPYVASWNFNVQQALTGSTSLQVAYVGNRGIKLFSHRDINQSDPTLNLACNDNGDDTYRGCRQDTRPFVT